MILFFCPAPGCIGPADLYRDAKLPRPNGRQAHAAILSGSARSPGFCAWCRVWTDSLCRPEARLAADRLHQDRHAMLVRQPPHQIHQFPANNVVNNGIEPALAIWNTACRCSGSRFRRRLLHDRPAGPPALGSRRSHAAAQPVIHSIRAWLTASGRSTVDPWPQLGTTTRRAPGIAVAISSDRSTG